MKVKKYIQITAGIILTMIVYLTFSDGYWGRLIRWNFPDVYDYQKFPYTEIKNPDTVFTYPKKFKQDFISKIEFKSSDKSIKNLEQIIAGTKTNALVIIQNDMVIYEQYFNGRFRESLCKAFSATKSVLSLMIGIALEEGYIENINDPLIKYITDFKNRDLGEITIKQCLNLKTGIKYDNSMSFLSDKPKFYYTLDVRELIKGVELENKPGSRWHSDEYSILLLGAVLEKATGQSISHYLQEKIWKPVGMEYPATFSVDSKENKFEHVADGLNAAAIDLAKIGSLMLKKGCWNGKQIVPAGWIEESTSLNESSVTDWNGLNYKYLWWIKRENGDYQAIGHFGQYIFVSPRTDLVIVRFGEEKGSISWWDKIFPKIVSELNKT